MEDEQLSRMKTKIDKLSEAVVAMARMEERNITVSKRFDMSNNAWKKYNDHMKIKRKVLLGDQEIAFAERIFWIILIGAIGLWSVYNRQSYAASARSNCLILANS